MRVVTLCSLTLLAMADAATAQEKVAQAACSGLAPDSFEAAFLNCDRASNLADPSRPASVVDVLGEPPLTGSALPDEFALSDPAEAPLAEIDPQSRELVRVIRGLTEVETLAGPFAGAAQDAEPARLQVPNGQFPPPGTCRIWFPDRYEGLQRAPGPCDVQVPEGAVLLRG